ncbi:MAG TPA: FHA domain-containing protein, partial [Pyrinomonadaceae bacterium]
MKIVLAEQQGVELRSERVFDRPTVKIGRDPAACQIVFNTTEWPTVSRQHAEFRAEGDHFLLIDTNSRCGTFLDGQRITGPAEVHAGAHVQLGAGGPVLKVVYVEPPGPGQAAPCAAASDEIEAPGLSPVMIEVVGGASARPGRVEIKGEEFYLGRSAEMDLMIEAAAASVSRRHAVVRRRSDQYEVVDLGSFNGTLINGRRITAPTLLYDGDQIQLGVGGPTLRFIDPAHPAPTGVPAVAVASAPEPRPPVADILESLAEVAGLPTIAVRAGSGTPQARAMAVGNSQPQLLIRRAFDKPALSLGRAPDNDI